MHYFTQIIWTFCQSKGRNKKKVDSSNPNNNYHTTLSDQVVYNTYQLHQPNLTYHFAHQHYFKLQFYLASLLSSVKIISNNQLLVLLRLFNKKKESGKSAKLKSKEIRLNFLLEEYLLRQPKLMLLAKQQSFPMLIFMNLVTGRVYGLCSLPKPCSNDIIRITRYL